MIHPRSLAWNEDRPPVTVWTCPIHGDCLPGDIRCDDCDDEDVEVAS